MESIASQSHQFLELLKILDSIPFLVLILIAFGITLIENLFPPAPSDIIFVATAVLVGRTEQLIIPLILAGASGATVGFWLMYLLGLKFDKKIIETNKIKFISLETIAKVEHLFKRWGMKLVVINRFVSGTRAIISFFAGMSALEQRRTIIYAGVSSLAYYGLLAVAGYYFGKDWRTLIEYFRIYKEVTLIVSIIVVIAILAIWIAKKIKRKQ